MIPETSPSVQASFSKLIFVSHCHGDKDLAEAVVDMLCTAVHLKRDDFRCTSVEGSTLHGGEHPDVVLRSEIREAVSFISLLTHQAFRSMYVLFELGARWGNNGHHIPLLAKGVRVGILKDPLKAQIALNLSEQKEVLRLVEAVASVLKREPVPVTAYLSKAQKIVEISRRASIEVVAEEKLHQCIEIIRQSLNLDSAVHQLENLQKGWKTVNEQITVVGDDKILLHLDNNLRNQAVAGSWKDGKDSRSLYSEMQHDMKGIKVVSLKGHDNRLTAIAFEKLDRPNCMVVVEVHYYPQNF